METKMTPTTQKPTPLDWRYWVYGSGIWILLAATTLVAIAAVVYFVANPPIRCITISGTSYCNTYHHPLYRICTNIHQNITCANQTYTANQLEQIWNSTETVNNPAFQGNNIIP